MEDWIYKIFTEPQWKQFQSTGLFEGSSDDRRDGFIHMSTKEQVASVIERFFASRRPLYVAEFSATEFLPNLKWETSASNELYPHVYGSGLLATDVKCFQIVTE